MSKFSSIIVGNGSLLVQCGEILLARGHNIQAIVTENPDIASWAEAKGIPTESMGQDICTRLGGNKFDWLFSIANLTMIPSDLLGLPRRGAVNFHDGPLPKYAGLNAPVWALINRETNHGITWHMMKDGVDEGDIIEQRMFDLSPTETALTLNTKCYEAAIDSFGPLVTQLETGAPETRVQDLEQRTYCALADRPRAAGWLDLTQDSGSIIALVRALDHGAYWNPLCCPKIEVGGQIVLVGTASNAGSAMPEVVPGTVLEVSETVLVVATSTGPVKLETLSDIYGDPIDIRSLAKSGERLGNLSAAQANVLTAEISKAARTEPYWRARLRSLVPAEAPLAEASLGTPKFEQRDLPFLSPFGDSRILAIIGAWLARLSESSTFDLAYRNWSDTAETPADYLSDWVPLRLKTSSEQTFGELATETSIELDNARKAGRFARDLSARDPEIAKPRTPEIAIVENGALAPVDGSCLTFEMTADRVVLHFDKTRVLAQAVDLLIGRLEQLAAALDGDLANATLVNDLPIMPVSEREQVLYGWNETGKEYPADQCVHQAFEAQVARSPDAVAVVFEDVSLTYAELNTKANRVALVLQGMGVTPGTPVGLYTGRSAELLVGALGIQKAGGAYVPLDPAYPEARISHYISDSRVPVIVTQSDLADDLPEHEASVLELDSDPRIELADTSNPVSGVAADDLAYLIYTSGSTGNPKGVMVEHRNVANFFAGMDDQITHNPPGVWMAVTSLSFDISVLELFYTLARGFKLVISGDENRAQISSGRIATTGKGMEFSLYFWGNDDGAGPKKYELLLEGAKFADKNGFCAVWTPERHFHAFGGPYPNPSVTGAAVAAVTKNLSVRAGSCVTPLHHPARVAEEWAIIDNLTNGKAGLAVAAGWQPDDFVLRPENAPPNNKPAMFEAVETIRKLWRGEMVDFPTAAGGMHGVVTQPRPVSKELPIWVTIAGNPETWREAGEVGAHVLTHLLGQSIDEVADKIKIYHAALRKAGHNPDDFKVTLMLHSYVGRDREVVRETARGPLKNYLTSAAGLIKQCAWAFPAFKKPKGVTNPFEIDLETLSADELEAILEFAFDRYFEESGLFGTVEDCLKRVEQLKRIGVAEVACLIDYGIPVPSVLEGLFPLAEVLRRANEVEELVADDYSIAAQILRHDVTHLQCTPSMARMLSADDEARHALGQIKHLMIGGEALPGGLVAEINAASSATVTNMYGPTETTIWSSTETASSTEAIVNIGRPIANTQLYVLDASGSPTPVGVPGELFIGGDGVTRGYWDREDLTQDRFVPDPFRRDTMDGRMYRTGDLVRRRVDGRVDFLGRVDHQIKLRGYRIELGEIEANLEKLPAIDQAVVVAREINPGDIRLVAYLRTDSPISKSDLRAKLAEELPDYMIPSHFKVVSEFPLTPNKKVDRNALPDPTEVKSEQTTDAPNSAESDLEQKIGAIWSRILGIGKVSATDSFFDLGGHSLLAVQAHREIRDELGVKQVNITDIFRFPKLQDLAAHLDVEMLSGQRIPVIDKAALAEKAQVRSDAMAKRRQMRARRLSGSA